MLLKSEIEKIYLEQKKFLGNPDTGLERELLEEIRLDTSLVTIITGIRRSGKSTLIKQLIKNRISDYFYLNFEDPRLTGFDLKDFEKLDEIFSKETGDKYYIFDEIQIIPDWEKYIRHKQDLGKKIIITGSNASLLSKELGTRLTGRHIDFELFPFSYSEFLKWKGQQANENSLNDYLKEGGFPEYLKYGLQEILFRLSDDIIYRDIAVRYGIKNHKILKELLIYLLTNSGKLFSYNNLKHLFSVGSSNTLIDYISFFENSYLLFTVPKFSYSIKKQIYNPKKIYSVDTGLTSALSLAFSEDSGRKLGNAVFTFLRKRYKNLFYFAEKYECDFLVMDKRKIMKAIQVCYHLNSDNLDRELNGLLEAMETTNLKEGTIITLNQDDRFVKDNKIISVIPAWKYFSGGS